MTSRPRILRVDTERKLNVHKDVFWTSYVSSIYILCLRDWTFLGGMENNEFDNQ